MLAADGQLRQELQNVTSERDTANAVAEEAIAEDTPAPSEEALEEIDRLRAKTKQVEDCLIRSRKRRTHTDKSRGY